MDRPGESLQDHAGRGRRSFVVPAMREISIDVRDRRRTEFRLSSLSIYDCVVFLLPPNEVPAEAIGSALAIILPMQDPGAASFAATRRTCDEISKRLDQLAAVFAHRDDDCQASKRSVA